jgi:ribosomal protein S18 acetylase RimI-like enzyme
VIDPIVRPADDDDVAQLIVLEGEARSSLETARGGPRWLETHAARGERWREVLETSMVFVSTIDDVVVGYIVATNHEDVAVIDEVYVSPGAREVGFGDAMLEAVIDSARSAGQRVLEGQALPGDRETKNLYERAGITARLITVSTVL